MRAIGLLLVATGCYSANSAASDVNAAWRGRARVDLEARIGAPTQQVQRPDGTVALRWVGHGYNITSLPSGSLSIELTPASFSIDGHASAGVIERTEYTRALAVVSPSGVVADFDGAFAAGFPSGLNVRTGFVFGIAAGLGSVANASKLMPSTSLYMGGMLGPRTALVGSYAFVNGKDPDDGYAMGHAWGLGVQYWPAARLNVRLSAAAVLDLEPGLENATFAPGAMAAASYAIVRSGSFVLDARFDAVGSTSSAFGMFGLGVNVN